MRGSGHHDALAAVEGGDSRRAVDGRSVELRANRQDRAGDARPFHADISAAVVVQHAGRFGHQPTVESSERGVVDLAKP
jgi:hypothetical protein